VPSAIHPIQPCRRDVQHLTPSHPEMKWRDWIWIEVLQDVYRRGTRDQHSAKHRRVLGWYRCDDLVCYFQLAYLWKTVCLGPMHALRPCWDVGLIIRRYVKTDNMFRSIPALSKPNGHPCKQDISHLIVSGKLSLAHQSQVHESINQSVIDHDWLIDWGAWIQPFSMAQKSSKGQREGGSWFYSFLVDDTLSLFTTPESTAAVNPAAKPCGRRLLASCLVELNRSESPQLHRRAPEATAANLLEQFCPYLHVVFPDLFMPWLRYYEVLCSFLFLFLTAEYLEVGRDWK